MGVYYVFIVSKSGGLIYNYDHNVPVIETEKTYSFPLDIQLKFENNRVIVAFGERDGVCIGHALKAVNGQLVTYKEMEDGRDVFDVIADKENYPLNLKFGRPKITTNEKIVLASTFYPLYQLAVQLSPDQVDCLYFSSDSGSRSYSTSVCLCVTLLALSSHPESIQSRDYSDSIQRTKNIKKLGLDSEME